MPRVAPDEGDSLGLAPSSSAHLGPWGAGEGRAHGPHVCFLPWPIPSPDLLPGADVQVPQAGCGLELPHCGVDPLLLEGHRVPCEPQGGQLRLQALQLPGRGERGGDSWGAGSGLASREIHRKEADGERGRGSGERREGAGEKNRENDLREGERKQEHPGKQERGVRVEACPGPSSAWTDLL